MKTSKLNLPERPYRAIQNGVKKVEGRAPGPTENIYNEMKHGIESYNSLTNYKDRIKEYGIYAIGIRPLS